MDTTAVEKRIDWIDEQRLKDAELLNRLNDQVTSQQKTIEQCERIIKEQVSEITRLSAISAKISEFNETIAQHRKEVSRQLKDAEELRTKKEKSLEEIRKSDLKEISKSIDELQRQISAMDKIQESLEARKEEEIRITRKVDSLSKQLEDFSNREQDRIRSMSSMEETIKIETKRVTDLQSDATELRKWVDTLRGLMDTSQDRTRKAETILAELASSANERREAQILWMEQQALRLADFEREWGNWAERFEKFEDLAAELDERMKAYEETYRNLKVLQKDLDDVIQRLERRITEVSELQRLAEDRFRQEWSTFQADDQKRWNSYKLTTDERWKEHDRLHSKLETEGRISEGRVSEIADSYLEFRQDFQERMTTMASLIREWIKKEDI